MLIKLCRDVPHQSSTAPDPERRRRNRHIAEPAQRSGTKSGRVFSVPSTQTWLGSHQQNFFQENQKSSELSVYQQPTSTSQTKHIFK